MEAHYTITQLVVVIGGRPVVKQDEGFNFKTSNWRGHYFRAREIAFVGLEQLYSILYMSQNLKKPTMTETTREIEYFTRKLHKTEEHLKFLNQCSESEILPKFTQIPQKTTQKLLLRPHNT